MSEKPQPDLTWKLTEEQIDQYLAQKEARRVQLQKDNDVGIAELWKNRWFCSMMERGGMVIATCSSCVQNMIAPKAQADVIPCAVCAMLLFTGIKRPRIFPVATREGANHGL